MSTPGLSSTSTDRYELCATLFNVFTVRYMSVPTPMTAAVRIPAMMIGLAVGIDYALFITSRFRDERAQGHDPEHAAGRAVGTAGSAVVFAGATVIIALIALINGLLDWGAGLFGYTTSLERILLKALAKEPDERYASARDMQLDIEQFAAELQYGRHRSESPAPSSKPNATFSGPDMPMSIFEPRSAVVRGPPPS